MCYIIAGYINKLGWIKTFFQIKFSNIMYICSFIGEHYASGLFKLSIMNDFVALIVT